METKQIIDALIDTMVFEKYPKFDLPNPGRIVNIFIDSLLYYT